ncbi:MAG: DUF4397 domain-containing protein [Melioribacteraceae bacterium]|nr:DUF4397 domain-containing protein [Melioribacteraceae bacterium]
MKLLRKFILVFLSAAFFISCADDNDTINTPVRELGKAQVRVIHASYDAPAVDVWVNDAQVISNLSYGESSGYAELEEGEKNIIVSAAGTTTPVISATVTIIANQELTIYAVNNLTSIEAIISEDDRISSGSAKVRFIHAAPDAPAVDIKVNNGMGSTLFGNAEFKTIADYIEVPEGTYNLAVTPAGSNAEVVILGNAPLMSGRIYTVMAQGTLSGDDSYPFNVRTYVDNNQGISFVDLEVATANVKVVHASPNAPAVDLLLNDAVVGTGLTFPNNTGYLNINAGTQNIKVNVSGTSTTAIEGDILFDAYKDYSVFAVNNVSSIEPLILEDNLAMPASGKAHLRFIHLSPDAPAVDITLTNGMVLFGNVSFKSYSEFTPFDAGTYDLQVRLAGTETVVLELPGVMLENQDIYTVFAKGFVNGTGDQALGAQIIINNEVLGL